jgi:outer membrane immunogenic protein
MHRFIKVLVAAATICGWSWSASARNDTIMKVADTPFQWAGLYFGVQAGGAWGTYKYCDSAGANCAEAFQFAQPTFSAASFEHFPDNISGVTAGGLVGVNLQFGAFVLGVEGDGNWISLLGNNTCTTPFPTDNTCDAKISAFATARARVGLAAGNVLFYGTGGWAWANVTRSGSDPNIPATVSQMQMLQGYTFGGGVETVFSNGWGMRGEWLYTSLLPGTYPATTDFGAVQLSSNFQVARFALIKHFGAN